MLRKLLFRSGIGFFVILGGSLFLIGDIVNVFQPIRPDFTMWYDYILDLVIIAGGLIYNYLSDYK